MPSHWFNPSLDKDLPPLELSPGTFVQFQAYDTSWDLQGTVLGHLIAVKDSSASGQWMTLKILGADDEYLQWWLEKGPGNKLLDKAWVHLCKGKPSQCGSRPPAGEFFHTDRMRIIDACDIHNNRF